MPSYVPIVGILELLSLVVATPVISVFIAYAGWNGKPKGFSRRNYFIAFVVIGPISICLMVLAQRMRADVRTAQYIVQVVCFFVGAFLLGSPGGVGWAPSPIGPRRKPDGRLRGKQAGLTAIFADSP